MQRSRLSPRLPPGVWTRLRMDPALPRDSRVTNSSFWHDSRSKATLTAYLCRPPPAQARLAPPLRRINAAYGFASRAKLTPWPPYPLNSSTTHCSEARLRVADRSSPLPPKATKDTALRQASAWIAHPHVP